MRCIALADRHSRVQNYADTRRAAMNYAGTWIMHTGEKEKEREEEKEREKEIKTTLSGSHLSRKWELSL